jgi:hypothetical protein
MHPVFNCERLAAAARAGLNGPSKYTSIKYGSMGLYRLRGTRRKDAVWPLTDSRQHERGDEPGVNTKPKAPRWGPDAGGPDGDPRFQDFEEFVEAFKVQLVYATGESTHMIVARRSGPKSISTGLHHPDEGDDGEGPDGRKGAPVNGPGHGRFGHCRCGQLAVQYQDDGL